ncbi:hypothetical protein [Streptococcus catagoni]|uniref:hypothetical protein n=1 Tax=Streptococcus catagoni TaxID=2654874 RepID=UPI00140CD2AD|nr:hypothetical protein [Streptococcus catagoni]
MTNLPVDKSIGVSVDGVNQGYTVRTSQANSRMSASFTAAGVGKGEPVYSS